MATSNIDEIEQLQQNKTLRNLLLRIDDDAIDQHQQNETLTNLLLRIDEIDDKNLTQDDNNGEEMYPIITHLQEPIFQNKITLSIGEVFTLDFYRNAAVFRSELPEVKQFSKDIII
jgi:hypothetical protein